MSSTIRSEIGMDLSIYKTLKTNVKVELKTAKYAPFICQVQGFLFDTDDTRVEFKRIDETIFPGDSENEKQETFITLLKNIKNVEEVKA